MAGGDQFKKRRTLTQAQNPMATGLQPRDFRTVQKPAFQLTPLNINQGPLPVRKETPLSPMNQPGGMSAMDAKRNAGMVPPTRPNYAATPMNQPNVNLSGMQYGSQAPMVGAMMPGSPASALMMGMGRVNTAVNNPSAFRAQGMTAASQAANPMTPPVSPYASQDQAMRSQTVGVRRTGQFMDDNPMASSSIGAAQIAGRIPADIYNPQTAGAANGYSGNPYAATAGSDYSRSLPTDQAGMANRIANQNPMYGDMQRRFGGQLAGLEADQAAVEQGRAFNMGGYGEGRTVYANKTPGQAEAAAIANAGRNNPAVRAKYDDPNAVANRQRFATAKANNHEDFKAANGGMSYRQAERKQQQERSAERSFQRAVRQGLNPMSPRAMALFPDQAGAARDRYRGRDSGVQNPMSSAFNPSAPRTAENINARAGARAVLETESPTVSAMGIAGGDPSTFAAGLMGYKDELSDEGLTDMHNYALALEAPDGQEDPFDQTPNFQAPDLLKQLRQLPQGTPPAKLRDWYTQYRAELKRRQQSSNDSFSASLPF